MNDLFAWLFANLIILAFAALIICLVRRPLSRLLNANSRLQPAAPFYHRTFILVISLGALAAITPEAKDAKAMTFMEWIWWIANNIEPVLWSLSLFLMGFVVLLTILFASLGRHHD